MVPWGALSHRFDSLILIVSFNYSLSLSVLFYADDVNLIRTIERNADVLLNACKDFGLAVNIGKTKYMEIGRHRGMIPNAHIKIGSNSYEKVKTFKYLGSLLTNQNSIQGEIKCRFKARNLCH